jgi:hypothetical protein
MGFLKSIRPTRTTFHGGLHTGGACRLPLEWNGCKNNTDFCTLGYVRLNDEKVDAKGVIKKVHFDQHFDEIVLARDAKLIEAASEGVLNHVQYRRLFIQASNESIKIDGEYSTSLFPAVYEELEKRGLVMPMELPDHGWTNSPAHDADWVSFLIVSKEVERAAERSKSGQTLRRAPLKLSAALPRIRFEDILQSNDMTRKFKDLESEFSKKPSPATLPAFSTDGSEVFLASMIEREADSWDLHLTTFLLDREILQSDINGLKATRIRPEKETVIKWSKVIVAEYNASHPPIGKAPKTPEYFCKIKSSPGGVSYMVKGESVSYQNQDNGMLVLLVGAQHALVRLS